MFTFDVFHVFTGVTMTTVGPILGSTREAQLCVG
jgi:hypothetical protein